MLEHGLAAALESLATRSTVPTTVSFEAPGRLPERVEFAAYFVASEALANVSKYAQASAVTMRVRRAGPVASIEIADDGVGGADDANGSGLRGLADRVEALDGTLRVVSPPGAGHGRHRGDAVRVVIADDILLVREGIASLLRGAGIDVAAEASTAEELLRAVEAARPRRRDRRHPDAARRRATRACGRRTRSGSATPRSAS